MYPIIANLAEILASQRSNKGGGEGDYESTAGWDWGWRVHPVTGVKQSWHNGIDIPIPVGTPLYAPWDGEVVKVFHATADPEDNPSGNAIRVYFSNAPSEIKGASFVHMDRFAPNVASVGDTFKAGDVIGYSGNTGRSTGPHLHFTLWASTSREIAGDVRNDTDPLPYLDESSLKKTLIGAGISGGMLLAAFLIYLWLRGR